MFLNDIKNIFTFNIAQIYFISIIIYIISAAAIIIPLFEIKMIKKNYIIIIIYKIFIN